MKCLHLLIDSIITDRIIAQLEEYPQIRGEYAIVSDRPKNRLAKSSKIQLLTRDEFQKKTLTYNCLWIHFLTNENIWACSQLSHHMVIWTSWGGDLVGKHHLFNEKYVFRPITLKNNYSFLQRVKLSVKHIQFLQEIYLFLNPARKKEHRLRLKAYSNIDIVSTILPSEKKLLPFLPQLDAKYKWFSYGSLNDVLLDYVDTEIKLKKGIMVGHSAITSLNHLDCFKLIKEQNIHIKVYCPVSYGSHECIKLVLKVGPKILSNINFETNIISQEEYLDRMRDNHILLLNSRVQQGVGNLITALYFGMKVFLDNESPLYEFCIENNLVVFKIEDFNATNIDNFLSEESIKQNRIQLKSIYEKKNVEIRNKEFINEALQLYKNNYENVD